MIQEKPSPPPTAEAPERRRHHRLPAEDQVTLCVKGPKEAIIPGQLVDVSVLGFRVRHASAELAPGQQVRLLYHWGDVSARVVWCRALHGGFETGFALA